MAALVITRTGFWRLNGFSGVSAMEARGIDAEAGLFSRLRACWRLAQSAASKQQPGAINSKGTASQPLKHVQRGDGTPITLITQVELENE